VLLAPAGSATTPPVSAFERRTTNDPGQTGTAIIAQGQRITNPAEWTQLVSSAERRGVTGTTSYQLAEGIEVYGNASRTQSRSNARTLPAYVSGVAVSAQNNLFGEAISFGMLLPQWGQVSQRTRTDSTTVTVGARGKVFTTWRWDAGYRWQQQKYFSISRSFNQTAFNFFANNNEAAQRFNPFIDERAPGAPNQSALLEQTALYPTAYGRSGLESLDFSANGDLVRMWGGTARMSFGFSYDRDKNTNIATTYAGFPVVTTVTPYTSKRITRAAYSELQLPFVGKANRLPLVERFEANLAGRAEDITGQEGSRVPKIGLTWSPFRPVLLRGSQSEGYRSPGLTENRRPTTTTTSTINDPLRGNAPTPITLVTRPNPELAAETSKTRFLGTVVEIPALKGLSLSANYYRTEQRNAIQSLSSTVILNNPALFPGFVVRNAPTSADTAAGLPGTINTLYSQYVNFGVIRNDSVDMRPTSGRRLALARSLTDGTHPLTARVLVNRVWHHLFGAGLVGTLGDFGALGERPTHPELLDWLASEWVRPAGPAGGRPWSLKGLVRLLVTSSAYRQATVNAAAQAADPDNRLLGRRRLRRLDAEALRDAVLAISGRLDTNLYGAPVPVAVNALGQVVVGSQARDGNGDPNGVGGLGGAEFRRSLYLQVRRSLPVGVIETFDAPALTPNCEVRPVSTVPPQALMLMNDPFVVERAMDLAGRLRREAPGQVREQIRRLWRLVYGVEPTGEEMQRGLFYLAEQAETIRAAWAAAGRVAKPGEAAPDPAAQALASLGQALLGSNRFLYVE
ncbi:MAG: TonB-dependent receptor domain-containing protein, partial [Verrucomicrobiota bacterium]